VTTTDPATPDPTSEPAAQPRFHALSYPDDLWTCPVTGIAVWKDPAKNLDKRIEILLEAESDPEYQAELMWACRRSFLLWVNLFGWTYVQIEHTQEGKRGVLGDAYRPFVTWPVQDDAALTLLASTGLSFPELEAAVASGRLDEIAAAFEVAIDKSREMGASWLVLALMLWLWLFYPNLSMLLASRRADEVETTGRVDSEPGTGSISGNPDTLFWKLDCLLHWLPEWMRPPFVRTDMHLQNLANGSVIDGSTTNDDVGRGGRRLIVAVDEAAAVHNLRSIHNSASYTAVTVWNISTPKAGSWYSNIVLSGGPRVITLGWWDDPRRGGWGREWTWDPEFGRMVVDGPYRQREKDRHKDDPRKVAENVDINHEAAGRNVFNIVSLRRHVDLFTRPPLCVLRFEIEETNPILRRQILRKRQLDRIVVREARPGEWGWRCWFPFDPDRPSRLPQDRTYVMPMDISYGLGASNSVTGLGDRHTRRIMAELATASLPPEQFAEQCRIAAVWFGGYHKEPFAIWEANGPGQQFGRTMLDLGQAWYYFDQKTTGVADETTQRVGWVSSDEKKMERLLDLRAAYDAGRLTNPSKEAVQEAMRYIRYEAGSGFSCGPDRLEQEGTEARKTHGDRVIMNMLMVEGFKRAPEYQPKFAEPPPGSPEAEIREMQRERKRGAGKW
jgi:hypothetical protein